MTQGAPRRDSPYAGPISRTVFVVALANRLVPSCEAAVFSRSFGLRRRGVLRRGGGPGARSAAISGFLAAASPRCSPGIGTGCGCGALGRRSSRLGSLEAGLDAYGLLHPVSWSSRFCVRWATGQRFSPGLGLIMRYFPARCWSNEPRSWKDCPTSVSLRRWRSWRASSNPHRDDSVGRQGRAGSGPWRLRPAGSSGSPQWSRSRMRCRWLWCVAFAFAALGWRCGAAIVAGAGVVMGAVSLPFILAARSAMWRMVVLDQIGRNREGDAGVARRLADIVTMDHAPRGGIGLAVGLVILLPWSWSACWSGPCAGSGLRH